MHDVVHCSKNEKLLQQKMCVQVIEWNSPKSKINVCSFFLHFGEALLEKILKKTLILDFEGQTV